MGEALARRPVRGLAVVNRQDNRLAGGRRKAKDLRGASDSRRQPEGRLAGARLVEPDDLIVF